MRALEFSDAPTFLEFTRKFLFAREIEHNLLLSSALTLTRNGSPRLPSLMFLAVIDKNEAVQAVALRSPNRRWILSTTTDDSAQFLGSELAKREPQTRSLFLPSNAASEFSTSFRRESGVDLARTLDQNLMHLDRVKKLDPAEGLMRPAQPKDLRRLIRWSHEFAKECGLDESPSEAEEVIRKYLQTKQLFVWENGTNPIAMAAYGGLTPKSVRISMVYTDPLARARGYASTLVHRLSHRLLNEGHAACVLFSDASNRSANKIYESVGYQTIAQFRELRSPDRAYRSPDNGLTVASSSH